MADFSARERQFNASIGGTMAGFATAAVAASNAADDANLARTLEVLKRPNVEFTGAASVLSVDQPMETRMSVPAVTVVPTDGFGVDTAKISMDMTVTEHMESATSVKSDTEVEGKIGFNVGPFVHGHFGLKSRVSVGSEKKRSSDYTATTHAELNMKRLDPPEGLAKIIDSMVAFQEHVTQLNSDIVQKQVEVAQQNTPALQPGGEMPPAVEVPTAPEEDKK